MTFVQGPEFYLNQLGVTVKCVVDPSRDAILDEAHRVFVNWETYYMCDDAAVKTFTAAPWKYAGTVTDPVSRERFRPDPAHHDDVGRVDRDLREVRRDERPGEGDRRLRFGDPERPACSLGIGAHCRCLPGRCLLAAGEKPRRIFPSPGSSSFLSVIPQPISLP